MTASASAARGASDELDALARGFDAFLDAVLEPDVQRIIITDAPAVLGLARFTELDERYAVSAIVAALQAADDAGRLHADDPETIARLLLGALVRGSMLIAGSADPAATRESVGRAVRALLAGFAPRPGRSRPRPRARTRLRQPADAGPAGEWPSRGDAPDPGRAPRPAGGGGAACAPGSRWPPRPGLALALAAAAVLLSSALRVSLIRSLDNSARQGAREVAALSDANRLPDPVPVVPGHHHRAGPRTRRAGS